MKAARNFAIVALVALIIAAAPGGGAFARGVLTLLGIAFFAGIAMFGYRLYREHRFTLESLPDLDRLVLYCAVGLAFLTFAGWPRLQSIGGFGWIVGILLFGVASLGVFWVIARARRYD